MSPRKGALAILLLLPTLCTLLLRRSRRRHARPLQHAHVRFDLTQEVAEVPPRLLSAEEDGEDKGKKRTTTGRKPECPELAERNGDWKGSRQVGGEYTLVCSKGYAVMGRNGSNTAKLTCPPNLQWPADLKCRNKDDCANLKHNCGPKGVCKDKLDGYTCNCDHGFELETLADGERVCGTTDEGSYDSCSSSTCGAYGECIEFDNTSPRERADRQHSPTPRCECVNGFEVNGSTCDRKNCGPLHDEFGEWTGSTLYNLEFTLRCKEGSFIDKYLTEVTISCGPTGVWLEHQRRHRCVSPAHEEEERQQRRTEAWISFVCVLICICSAAMAAGLTLGLATVDPFGLKVVMNTRPEQNSSKMEKEKLKAKQSAAEKILPLVEKDNRHRLLVTLMLFNTVANEALPIFLEELVPDYAAVLISVTAVLICGEILPSAIFTGPSQLSIGASFVPFVNTLQWVFHFVSKPIVMLLGVLLEEDADSNMKYSRAELRALLDFHGHDSNAAGSDKSNGGSCREELSSGCETSGGSSPLNGITANSAVNSSSLACLLECNKSSNSHEHEEHHAPPAILKSSELQLLNGALLLKEVMLDSLPYAKFHQCLVATASDSAASLVSRNLLQPSHRAVLVLNTQAHRDAHHVKVSGVQGCLQPLDLVRGGQQTLGSLCTKPLVRIKGTANALEALRCLVNEGSTLGIVETHDGTAEGVVAQTQLLSCLIQSNPRIIVQDLEETRPEAPPAVHTAVPQKYVGVGSRHLLTRCSTLDVATHQIRRTLSTSSSQSPLARSRSISQQGRLTPMSPNPRGSTYFSGGSPRRRGDRSMTASPAL